MIVHTNNIENGMLTVRITERSHMIIIETDDHTSVTVFQDGRVISRELITGRTLPAEVI